jgi:hypothetical protein
MNRLAARHSMAADVLEDAHDIRRLRNAIVHRTHSAEIQTMGECRAGLATFLSYMPRRLLG